MFLWMNPRPPCRAKAIANLDSVTVSIAAETIGILSKMFCVNFVARFTSLGSTFDAWGTNKTSSNVRPS